MSLFTSHELLTLDICAVGTSSRLALGIIRNSARKEVTYEVIAHEMGVTHDRVRKAVQPLVTAGLVEITYRHKESALIKLVKE